MPPEGRSLRLRRASGDSRIAIGAACAGSRDDIPVTGGLRGGWGCGGGDPLFAGDRDVAGGVATPRSRCVDEEDGDVVAAFDASDWSNAAPAAGVGAVVDGGSGVLGPSVGRLWSLISLRLKVRMVRQP